MTTTAKKATAKKAAAPKKTTATAATPRRTPARPAPEKTISFPVGTTVDLEVDEDATDVVVERPDGSEVTVFASGGRAVYVLDQVGTHVAGGLAVVAEPEGTDQS